MLDLLVVDIETTGLLGALKGDRVVEVGVARVSMKTKKVYPFYSAIINRALIHDERVSWVFENTDLEPDDVEASPHTIKSVVMDMRRIASLGIPMTSYYRQFDFDMFLSMPPFSLPAVPAPCIKEQAKRLLGPGVTGRGPSAQVAYDHFCPDNPARLPNGKEEHRALSDAIMEGYILLAMCEKSGDIAFDYLGAIGMAQRLREIL